MPYKPVKYNCPYGTVSFRHSPPEYWQVVYLLEVKEEYRKRPSDGIHPKVKRWIYDRFVEYEPIDEEGARIALILC
jgi:hypothetical protein